MLVGSAARGEGRPDSDLDFLVMKAGVPHRRRLAQQIYRFGLTMFAKAMHLFPLQAAGTWPTSR
jgi:predicted nucleotidyltransferase